MKLTVIAASMATALAVALPACAQYGQPGQGGQSGQSGQGAAGAGGQSPSSDQRGAAAGGSAATGSTARGQMHVQQNQTRQQTFQGLDKNNDGMISRQEAAASPELVLIFTPADANSDGQISVIEFQAVPLVQPDGTMVK